MLGIFISVIYTFCFSNAPFFTSFEKLFCLYLHFSFYNFYGNYFHQGFFKYEDFFKSFFKIVLPALIIRMYKIRLFLLKQDHFDSVLGKHCYNVKL